MVLDGFGTGVWRCSEPTLGPRGGALENFSKIHVSAIKNNWNFAKGFYLFGLLRVTEKPIFQFMGSTKTTMVKFVGAKSQCSTGENSQSFIVGGESIHERCATN